VRTEPGSKRDVSEKRQKLKGKMFLTANVTAGAEEENLHVSRCVSSESGHGKMSKNRLQVMINELLALMEALVRWRGRI
jgi:hypothetical protein